jgi:hypothetical protein
MKLAKATNLHRKSGGSEVEGPAVLSSSNKCKASRHPPLYHPERSRGICSPLNRHPIRMKTSLLKGTEG